MNAFANLVMPVVVFETDSPLNGHIRVLEKGRTRKLYAGDTLQSVNCDSPLAERMCWGKVVDIIQNNIGCPGNMLLLGLGGGTIPHLVANKCPGVSIVSVDLDPIMVDVGRKYFDLDGIPNHRIIVDDACRLVTSPEEFGISPNEFDVIIVNIYVGEKYPDLGNSGGFFAGIKKLLRPGGLAIFNRIYLKHHQDEVNNFIDNVSQFYTDVKSVIVAGITNSDNVVIYGYS
ncbi:MAG: methyltransferase domain-containing protein [Patescibacteria group bacterium]